MAINLNIVSKFDDKGLKRAQTSLANFGKAAGAAAAAAVGAVGVVGVQSVRAFADFDEALNQSLAIMGDVSDALRNDMSDAAREVAKTTRFSADQVAEAYYFLASAGLDATASIAAMPQVAQFAQAGMFDLATATDLLTDAQSAMGLTSDDATENLSNMARMSDVLVKANTLANASVEQFSEALTNKAAASMRSLNIPLEQGVATLAVFADQGIKGSQAGTTFNAMIRGLTNGVQRNEAAFKRMNIEVYDAEGNFNDLGDIVADIERAIGDMSVEQQRAALTQLGFTEETLAGTLALMGNSDAIKDYEQSLMDAGGTTEEVANNQLQSLQGQLDILKGQFEDIKLSIGEALAPTVEELIAILGPTLTELEPLLINLFEQLAPVISEIIQRLPEVIESLIPLIPIVGDLALLFLDLVTATLPVFEQLMETLGPTVETFSGFLAAHGEVVGALIVTFALFRGALLITTGAMGLFAGSSVAAQGASSGLFAVIRRHPFAAFVAATATAGFGLMQLGETAVEQKEPFGEFYIAIMIGANETLKFMRRFINQLIGLIETGLNGILNIVRVYNSVMEAVGGKTVNLPTIKIPRVPETTEMSAEIVRLQAELGAISFGDDAFNERRASEFERLQEQAAQIAASQAGIDALYGGGGMAAPPAAGPAVNYNVYIDAGLGVNGNRLGEDIISIIERYEREAGPVFAGAQQ